MLCREGILYLGDLMTPIFGDGTGREIGSVGGKLRLGGGRTLQSDRKAF